ncbi:MAG: NRDE family protein [Burkholderiales bacterium]|nr:NRDE family protein [Flavobacterium sp.]
MCTVSFVCANDKIIITSNRDEQVLRPAIPPKNYLINNKKIVFPKDPKAGGTWYAVDDSAAILVLLNGASEKHHWKPPYRRSRGLIVLDIISGTAPIESWEAIDLENLEPFTLILYQTKQLYQLRWDGVEKELVRLDATKNYVWSSATLYPAAVREKRQEWFYQFLDNNPDINQDKMFHFHRYSEDADKENGLIINRNDKLKTLSITQTVLEKNKVVMVHHDLIDQKQSTHSFIIV